MKNFMLRLVVFAMFVASAPAISVAGSAAPNTADKVSTVAKTKKELRKQKRAERMTKFIKKRVEKRLKKHKKYGKDGFSDLDRNLQLSIIFAAGAVALSILGSIIGTGGFGIFWTLASIAWLVAVVFLVLWIIENV